MLSAGGTATPAEWQTALRAVTYSTTSDAPSTLTRTVSFRVNDGAALNNQSNIVTHDINVTSVNDAPSITLGLVVPNFIEGGGPVVVDAGLTVADPDNASLASGTISITNVLDGVAEVLNASNCLGLGLSGGGTATLTLATSGTLLAYQNCLQSVTYNNTSLSPTTTARNIRFVVNDGTVNSAAANKALTVNGVNTAPTVTTTVGTTAFTEGGSAVAVDAGVTVTDPDTTNLASATVQITTNCQSGEDVLGFTTQNGITGVYTAVPSCILALTGSSTVANYQTALASVTYNNTSQNPNTTNRVVSFTANDGVAASNTATKTVSVTAVNNAPVVTLSGSTPSYTEGGAAVAVDSGVTVTDADSTNLNRATLEIVTGCTTGDVLNFTTQNGISGVYNAAPTCLLTLSGVSSVANYQTALQSVTFSNPGDDPTTTTRVVRIIVRDDPANGLSTQQDKSVAVVAVNDAPAVTPSAGTLTWNAFGGPQAVDSAFTSITDVDDANMESATVTIQSGVVDGASEKLNAPTRPR